MPKFSESPYFILLEYLTLVSKPYDSSDDPILNGASLTNSYLGLPNNIIVNGGSFVDFYIKDDDYGFRPIRLLPVYETPKEGIYFKFEDWDRQVLIAGTSVTETLSGTPTVSGYTYEFDLYDYTYDSIISPDDHITKEIYFKKNSPFYEWLEKSAYFHFLIKLDYEFSIRTLINTDKNFLYFGTLYPGDKV